MKITLFVIYIGVLILTGGCSTCQKQHQPPAPASPHFGADEIPGVFPF